MQRGKKTRIKSADPVQVKKTCRFIPNPEVVRKMEKQYADYRPHYFQALSSLLSLTNGIEKMGETYFSREGFSRSRYLTLMVLYHAPDNRMTPNEIAGRLEFTRGNMTGLIDQLLKDGYVTKTSDPVDRRQVWIELTAKGHTYLKKIFPDYFRRLARMMESVTREEIAEFIRISNKISESIPRFWDEDKDGTSK
jgi:DNA-binding MarR family transcriptional regulator